MKNFLRLLFFLLSVSTILSGQAQQIAGEIIDFDSGQLISFATIGVIGKNIGCVSNKNGQFVLNVSDGMDEDILRFSFVGYESYDVHLKSIRKNGLTSPIILKEKVIEIKEVMITSKRLSFQKIGLQKKKCFPIPFYKRVTSNISFPQKNYHHELGTLFKNAKPLFLDSIELNFSQYLIDSLDLRINIYSYQNDQFVNVLKKPIYLQLMISEKSNHSPIIDLSNQDIFLETDFLVTIENYKRLDNDSYRILANFKSPGKKHPTYHRINSQSEWQNLKYKSRDFGLSFIAFVKQ